MCFVLEIQPGLLSAKWAYLPEGNKVSIVGCCGKKEHTTGAASLDNGRFSRLQYLCVLNPNQLTLPAGPSPPVLEDPAATSEVVGLGAVTFLCVVLVGDAA